MSVDPTSNPIPAPKPTSPTSPTQPIQPSSGGSEPRPFSMGPESSPTKPGSAGAGKATPLEVARDAQQQQQALTPPELQGQIGKLQDQLKQASTHLQNPQKLKNLTDDHYQALQKLTTKLNPDLQTIAKETNVAYTPPLNQGGTGKILNYVNDWLNGSQQSLNQSLNFLSQQKNPSPASFMKLQYAVQRAVQRGELFSSIIGASVSGIKTIMSTQLG